MQPHTLTGRVKELHKFNLKIGKVFVSSLHVVFILGMSPNFIFLATASHLFSIFLMSWTVCAFFPWQAWADICSSAILSSVWFQEGLTFHDLILFAL